MEECRRSTDVGSAGRFIARPSKEFPLNHDDLVLAIGAGLGAKSANRGHPGEAAEIHGGIQFSNSKRVKKLGEYVLYTKYYY